MDENKVVQVIAALSRIEKSAEGIKSDTESSKSEYAGEIEDKIKAFDSQLEAEHEENMKKLAEKLETGKKEALLEMRAEMAVEVGKLDEAYEKHHEQIAKEVFMELISE